MFDHHQVFKAEREGDTLIVVPQGNDVGFRYNTIHIESNAVSRALDDPDVKNLVIDLSLIDSANSIVIGAFISMARKTTNGGGRAAWCAASANTQEILTTMNLFKLWPHFPDRAQALASFEA